jgi:hypothetical protein
MEAGTERVERFENVILTRRRGGAEEDAESFEMNDKSKPENTETAEIRAVVENVLTDQIIGCAIEVHRHLGPGCGHKLDLVVEDSVVVELKSIENLTPLHQAQLLTYLKSSNKRVGLLINFNVPILKNGLKRVVNRYAGPAPTRQTSADSALEPLPASQRLSLRLRVSASERNAQSTEAIASKDPL